MADVLGMRYHRIILESASRVTTASLKDFDYSFVVAMNGFDDAAYEVVRKKSCLIDLSKDIDAIVNSFSSTSRNEYRRSERISELQFHSSINGFKDYYTFYADCEKARDWLPVPPAELEASIVFSATYSGHPISGMSCYAHDKRLRVGRIYSSKRFKRDNTLNNTLYGSAAKRIVVEICKYGITHGYTTVDLGGIDLSAGSKSGITQFKLSMGGEIVDVSLGRYMTSEFSAKLSQIKAMGWDIT